MKPYLHANKSAKKYGGVVEDYLDIHNFFDQTKAFIPDMRHRAILHNAFGIFLCEQQFGVFRVNSAGKTYQVRDVGEDHVIEDLGHIPTLEKCLGDIPKKDWFFGRVPLSTRMEIIDGANMHRTELVD